MKKLKAQISLIIAILSCSLIRTLTTNLKAQMSTKQSEDQYYMNLNGRVAPNRQVPTVGVDIDGPGNVLY